MVIQTVCFYFARVFLPVTVLIAVVIRQAPAAAAYYVAPDGNDTNSGIKSSPFATLQKAQQLVTAGDTVFFRGGVYAMPNEFESTTSPFANHTIISKSGTSTARIHYWAFPGETPVFDFQNVKPAGLRVAAFRIEAEWVHIRGFEVIHVQNASSEAFQPLSSNNIYEQLSIHHAMGSGVFVRRGANNLFLNCDAYEIADSNYHNSDGFGCHSPTAGVNVFRGCRAWFNSDDGFDCIGNTGTVVYDHCWAFYSGYVPGFVQKGDGNGFKVGGYGSSAADRLPNPIPSHTITFCLAVKNYANGFYNNHKPGGSTWYNNTACMNGNDYSMLGRLMDNVTDVPGTGHTMRNNLSYKPRGKAITSVDPARCDISHNSWDLNVTVTDADFESLDLELLTAPRKSDGSLPDIPFMKLKAGSGLINKGSDVGFAFVGAAPDIGAYEYGEGAARIQPFVQKKRPVVLYRGENGYQDILLFDLAGRRLNNNNMGRVRRPVTALTRRIDQ